MRSSAVVRTALSFAFLASFASLAACSSGSDAASGGSSTDPTSPTGGPSGTTEAPEAPITSRPVCAAVTTDASTFGKGCSGTSFGAEMCIVPDTTCGRSVCVFDDRNKESYSLTCTAKCTVGAAEGCPLGYECAPTSDTCSGDKSAVCAPTTTCFAGVKASSVFEGAAGELYALDSDGKKATLYWRNNGALVTLASYDVTTTPSVDAVVRSGERVLVVTDTQEILVEGGKGTLFPRAKAGSGAPYDGVWGTLADGSFVKLDQPSNAYATLQKRNDDGTWTEVGPTRQRLRSLRALEKGFTALCQSQLCTSTDGETFTNLAPPPPGVVFDDKTTFSIAGLAPDDFYLTANGRLLRFKKGIWAEEGPKALPQPPGSSTSSSYADRIVVSAKGTAAFHTWNGRDYTTYATVAGCWRATTGVSSAALVGETLAYRNTDSKLCTVPVR